MNFDTIPWQELRERYEAMTQQLMSPSLSNDERLKLQKESAQLSRLLQAYDEVVVLQREQDELQQQLEENDDADMNALIQDELEVLQEQKVQAEALLEEILYPPNEVDNRSVFIEIRSGAGGQEAALFAADLLKMYLLYAAKKGWRTSVTSESETDLGGYREVAVHIQGKNAYGHLKYESGVHRVQRVPSTDTAGRVHTSTATVAVLPEAKEVDVDINPSDLRIDVYRSSGAGGQHVNTTDSAVRITHIPTGVVVTCQDERSQHKNKAKALKILKSRILMAQQEAQVAKETKLRKEMVGTGMRAEKVRTYNYPQNRISDHQVNLTLKKLDMVMETGGLDEIVGALMQKEREDRRNKQAAIIATS